MPARASHGASHHAASKAHHGAGSKRSSAFSIDDEVEVGVHLDPRVGHKQVYSKAVFEQAHNMPVVRKINRGRFDDILMKDVQQLFDVLDNNASGNLEKDELEVFLKEVMEPPCTDDEVELLWQFTRQSEASSTINAEEFFSGLVAGPMKAHLKAKQQEFRRMQMSLRARGLNAQVDRALLAERISWRVSRDDAFATLPLTMLTLLVFVVLVMGHLQIDARMKVATGLEDWVEGYGAQLTGPYLTSYVADTAGMWDWLQQSGLPSVFGGCHTSSETSTHMCHLASRSSLIGDAQLRQFRADGSEEGVWLLHSNAAKAHLSANQGDFLGAARAEATNLVNSGWTDQDTDEFQLRFSTWCVQMRIFAITEVRAIFSENGEVVPLAATSATMTAPYGDGRAWLYAVDVIYIFCLLYPMYFELKDIFVGVKMNGLVEGFLDYWGLWNAVDWCNICMGFATTALWLATCSAMSAPSLQALTQFDGAEGIDPDVMTMQEADIEQIVEDLLRINTLFFYLQICMGTNACSIVAKFFKAFQANPRLRLVTDTMVRAAQDIAHFSIVFLAVFIAFATIGHIFFGGDLVQFSSFGRSINTAFVVLMGEFSWYVEATDSSVGLGSGMPIVLMILWFWAYMIFVLLILLNMLLAIVLEHYTELQMEIKQIPDARPVWTQARNYVKRKTQTKGFIPLFDLLCQLEDHDQPAHPELKVTKESLLRHFEGMKIEQAEWLMDWLSKEAALKMMEGEDDEETALLKEIESLVETMGDEQKVVHLSLEQFGEKLTSLREVQADISRASGDHGLSAQAASRMNPDLSMSSEDGFMAMGSSSSLRSGPVYREPRVDIEQLRQLAMSPPTRGQMAMQMASQAEGIKELSRSVQELTDRMDVVAPKMKPLPAVLRDLSADVSSIKTRMDKLATRVGDKYPERTARLRSPPRHVGGCLSTGFSSDGPG